MRTTRTALAAMVAAGLLLIGCAGPGDGIADAGLAADSDTAPRATEVGVTATELHVAVLADVENPVSPGIFRDAREAMDAWARTVNERGGLAGRRVVIDAYDTRLNPQESKYALDKACGSSLLIAGSAALSLVDGEVIDTCADRAGAATGILNLPALSVSAAEASRKGTYALIGNYRDYRDPEPDAWTVPVGLAHWLNFLAASRGQSGARMLTVTQDFMADQKTITAAQARAFRSEGIDVVASPSVLDIAPQSEYAPAVNTLRQSKATVVNTFTYQSMAKFRKEANAEGVKNVTWTCLHLCSDNNFLRAGGADIENTYVFGSLAPLAEPDATPGVKAYIDAVGADKATANGLAAWAQALLAQRLITDLVARDGVNGLTRRALLGQIRERYPQDFTADGINGGRHTPVGRQSDCYVVSHVVNGQFERIHPNRPGTLDCDAANVNRSVGPPG